MINQLDPMYQCSLCMMSDLVKLCIISYVSVFDVCGVTIIVGEHNIQIYVFLYHHLHCKCILKGSASEWKGGMITAWLTIVLIQTWKIENLSFKLE